YPVNQKDAIRRAYIYELGSCQHILSEYQYSGPTSQPRQFQAFRFKSFPWLEYSPTKDVAYYFSCYLFTNKPIERLGANVFFFLLMGFETSHFSSLCSLKRMFNPTCLVLKKIVDEESTYSQREDATFAYDLLTSFDFVFILHLMKEIMAITDILSQILQQKYQDIVNAMQLVASSKSLI
ncbi:hypothetical protein CFOL_v3_24906, partial [Cephalotus follicularis]